MKSFILIFIISVSYTVIGQTWDQQYERAVFEVIRNNDQAFRTKISKESGSFTGPELLLLEEKFLEKEAVFRSKINPENSITVLYLSAIDNVTLQYLVDQAIGQTDVLFDDRTPHVFNEAD